MLLTDTRERAFYVGGPLGQDPTQVLLGPDRAVDLAGWWLTDQELLLPLQDPSAGPLGRRWYFVDAAGGSVQPLGGATGEPSVIYAASPNGKYWIEDDFDQVDVASRDGERWPLWPDGTVGGEQIPYPQQMAILPDASAVLFPGCTGERIAQTLTCGIIRAEIGKTGVLSSPEIYHIGSHSSVNSLQVSPDGRSLAFNSFPDELIMVLDLTSGEVVATIDWEGTPRDPSLVWSPDSSVLAVSSELETGTEVTLHNLQTTEIRRLPILSGLAVLRRWRFVPSQ